MTSLVWTTPGLVERLIELQALTNDRALSFGQIAKQLNDEFSTSFTRNALIGKSRRLRLPPKPPVVVVIKKRKAPAMPRKRKPKVDAPILHIEPPRLVINDDGLSIYQLQYGDCRWPLGVLEDHPPYQYCGLPSLLGKPYCPAHCRRAWNTPQARWA